MTWIHWAYIGGVFAMVSFTLFLRRMWKNDFRIDCDGPIYKAKITLTRRSFTGLLAGVGLAIADNWRMVLGKFSPLTGEDIQKAIDACPPGGTVDLTRGAIYTIRKTVTIDKPVVLNLNHATLIVKDCVGLRFCSTADGGGLRDGRFIGHTEVGLDYTGTAKSAKVQVMP